MNTSSLQDRINQVIEALNEEFPTAKFSFGYLMDLPCPIDLQQWYVFTQVPTTSDGQYWQHDIVRRHMFSFSVGGHMDKIAQEITSHGFHQWIEYVMDDIDSSRHVTWLAKCAS